MHIVPQDLALITGASAGIGQALAEQLAAKQANLVIVARSADKLEALRQSLQQTYGVTVHVIAVDLSAVGGAAKLCSALSARSLRPSIVVNCAAVGATGALWHAEADALSAMLRLNNEAPVLITRHCLPDMLAAGRGTIMNVSSMVSAFPVPFMASYGASKAFVSSFTQALREELRGSGVNAVELSPGVVISDFQAAAGYTLTAAERRSAMVPTQVASSAIEALLRNRSVRVPGWLNTLAYRALAVVPAKVMAFFTARFMRQTGRAKLNARPIAVAAPTRLAS